MNKKTIAVLTGAGISAESGLKTFRDANGLWEGYNVQDVASIEGWHRDQDLVLDFYNQRRRQLLEVKPNAAHKALVALEDQFDVQIITQNVDDLHERAGSTQVVHLHGELLKVRSTSEKKLVYEWKKDLITGDLCEQGHQLRPHIVWFGEMVPLLETAAEIVSRSEIVMIIGTSMQVYPAASLVGYAPRMAPIYYVDPKPSVNFELSVRGNLNIIEDKATSGVVKVVEDLLNDYSGA